MGRQVVGHTGKLDWQDLDKGWDGKGLTLSRQPFSSDPEQGGTHQLGEIEYLFCV